MSKKLQLRNEEGEVLDEYEVTDHDYYRVESPDGALITELSQ